MVIDHGMAVVAETDPGGRVVARGDVVGVELDTRPVDAAAPTGVAVSGEYGLPESCLLCSVTVG